MLWKISIAHFFLLLNSIHCMDILWLFFILLLTDIWVWFQFLAIINTAMNISIQVLMWTYIFIFFGVWGGKYLEMGLLSFMVSMFNFLKHFQTDSQSECTILYSHWQCTRLPVAPDFLHLKLMFFCMFVCFQSNIMWGISLWF